mmetsp:Transcript_62574/g.202877  ORF Transcript_62574/g.202877 Transcript_62574/m.202877 type:complete len:190 (-) Transcript_62574:138-707(-)
MAARAAPAEDALPAANLRKAPSGEHVAAPAVRLAAAPAKLAMKAKALPARGAMLKVIKTVMKVAAPKAAGGRGAPAAKAKGKAKAKAKAIAAKSFAAVAAKAKSGETSAKGSGTWYFMSDLRKTKAGADDSKAWHKFDPKMNKALEMAYTKNFSQYTMTFKGREYIVKFKTMMQFRADDKTLQRPVKRV